MTLHFVETVSSTARVGPRFATARLVLRAPRLDDAPAVAALANDLRIAENLSQMPHPYGVDDAELFIAGADTAFLLTLGQTPIGMARLASAEDEVTEFALWLGSPYWGQGYGNEAAHAILAHAFDHLGYDTLHAFARVTSPSSAHFLEKAGFRWTSVGLQRFRSLSSSAPVDHYRLDRDDWAKLDTAPLACAD